MTVSSSTDRATFPGNGVATAFSLPFRFFANSDVVASAIIDATGVSTPLTLGIDYLLTGAGQPEEAGAATGILTTSAPVPAGVSLFVRRIIPATQPTDIVNQGRFFPEVHETVFDRLTMLVQQSEGALIRALRVQDFDPEPNRLPAVAQRANKLLAFDSLGNPVAAFPSTDSSADIRIDLNNSEDATKGAGMSAFNQALPYTAGSVGAEISALIQKLSSIDYFVSPFDFGAIGDGVTDDSVPVQAAITLAQTEGRAVDLRGGNFLVADLASTGVDILSTKPGASLIPSATAAAIIDVSGSVSFKWINFTFDGAGTSARAFRIAASGNVNFQNVNIKNFTQRVAFFEKDVASALIEGGVVSNCSAADVYCYKANNGKFRAIHFKDCGEHVIRFGRFGSDPVSVSVGTSVIGCSFLNILNDPVLYELGSRRGVVANNTYSGCRRIVKVETTAVAQTQDIVVANNVFTNQVGVAGEVIKLAGVVRSIVTGNQIDGALMGITVGNQSRVSDNYIRNMTDYGILYDASCTVSGNVLDAIGGDGIRADSTTSSRPTITGNAMVNVTGIGINASGSDSVITGNAVQSTGAAVRLVSTSNNSVVVANNFRGSAAVSNSSTGSIVTNNIV